MRLLLGFAAGQHDGLCGPTDGRRIGCVRQTVSEFFGDDDLVQGAHARPAKLLRDSNAEVAVLGHEPPELCIMGAPSLHVLMKRLQRRLVREQLSGRVAQGILVFVKEKIHCSLTFRWWVVINESQWHSAAGPGGHTTP